MLSMLHTVTVTVYFYLLLLSPLLTFSSLSNPSFPETSPTSPLLENVNTLLYPLNSLHDASASHLLYPLGGNISQARYHHILVYSDPYLLIHGGQDSSGNYLSDSNIYDVRDQKWSGTLKKLQGGNFFKKAVDTIALEPDVDVSRLLIGFEGSEPEARGEHAGAGVNSSFYIFGGISRFGLMNDFHVFSSKEIYWKQVSQTTGSWPSRRAGHCLHSYQDSALILFGGRGYYDRRSQMTSLNDVWSFDLSTLNWQLLKVTSRNVPAGRLHFASTVYLDHLWIFGGFDWVSDLTFNDLWCFDISGRTWKMLSPNSGSLYGFLPPPLHHVHMIPISNSGNSTDRGILIFGGIGSGGSCGGSICNASQLLTGQLYKFEIFATERIWPRLYPDVSSPTQNSAPPTPSSHNVKGGEWKYAKLSSNVPNGMGGTGKVEKFYALEQVALSPAQNVLYEFGGVYYNNRNAEEISNDEIRKGQGSHISDAGGYFKEVPWDLHTNEHVRSMQQLPRNSEWWYSKIDDSDVVTFMQLFRQYTIASADLVLLTSNIVLEKLGQNMTSDTQPTPNTL